MIEKPQTLTRLQQKAVRLEIKNFGFGKFFDSKMQQ